MAGLVMVQHEKKEAQIRKRDRDRLSSSGNNIQRLLFLQQQQRRAAAERLKAAVEAVEKRRAETQ